MQFLVTEILEHGVSKGFDRIPGTVEKIVTSEKKRKVSHMGWNDVQVAEEINTKTRYPSDSLSNNFKYNHANSFSRK